MPLSTTDRELLKTLYGRVRDHALTPESAEDRELYYPLYEAPGCYDPISEIETKIEWTGPESVQFLSGFNGSGKTTEFHRLKRKLERAGYSVLMADYQDYLSPAEPVEASELLLVIAGAFGDRIEKDLASLNVSISTDSYWTRLWHYVTTTELNLTEASVKGEISIADVAKTGADLKLNLQSTPTFRQRVKKLLESKLGHLKQEVDKQILEGVRAIQERNGERPIVFLFDSIEKLRGSFSNEADVRRSVEMLFSQHLPLLRFPNIHMVYAVPAWLKFIKQSVGSVVMLPSIRLHDQTGQRHLDGWNALRGLLGRRFMSDDNWHRLFGAPDEDGTFPHVERIIESSGGDFRTLLNLVREVLLRASRQDALPVTAETVKDACAAVREQMLPIPIEEARRLERIARTKSDLLETDSGEEVSAVTRLLDTHRLLYLKNGGEWYDVHPLIRDEVKSIVSRNPERRPDEPA
jgi:hypothetical protein